MRLMRTIGMLLILALFIAPAAMAIDIALPSDIYTYDWMPGTATPQAGITMYTGWQVTTDGTQLRGYAMGLDNNGDVVYFKQGPRNVGLSYWNPENAEGKHTHGIGHIAHSQGIKVLNDDFTVFHEVSPVHPEDPDNYELTSFEGIYDDEGTVWTLWFHYAEDDLSDLGGYEDAIVEGQVIERRDLDGNLIWSWSSHDHMTGVGNDLRYEFMDNDDAYLEQQFRPLHINGYQVTDNGNVLVSARFMSLVFLIDYETGDILWRIGGGGEEDGNQFTYTGDAGTHPLSFNRQHDPRLDPATMTLTVFDNGNAHANPRSYAREYHLDTDNMEAELTWFHYYEDEVFDSAITGSVRQQDDGNYLIGWGALDPPVHATEVASDGEIAWQVHFHDDPVFNMPVRQVRAVKTPALEPAAEPYACYVLHDDFGDIELVANWFGHEAEVDAYEIWWGEDSADTMVGTSTTGFYSTGYDDGATYYAKVRALNSDGDPISDFSPEIEINTNPLSVDEPVGVTTMPRQITLAPAWPNPFNSATRMNVVLNQPSDVRVQVFDVLGRQVTTLHDGRLSAGSHSLLLRADDMASGTYFIRAIADDHAPQTRRVTLVR